MKKKNQPTTEEVAAETQLPDNETISETKTETNAETPEENPEEKQDKIEDKTEDKREVEVTPAADLEARLAEAENRGYLRGRNERIAELMREPAMFERQSLPAGGQGSPSPFSASTDWQGDSKPMILNSPHISIWDK